ncbi:MAG: aldo/keto reductase [Planctomycetia bacterium]|nr:aldo/keto reductase [Planctomycetia bacterium]
MDDRRLGRRRLGRRGPLVSPIGFGAFKIGRNQNTKYGAEYELPDDRAVAQLLNSLLDLGINYIDTAPAYGLSEARIGAAIGHRRHEFTLSTKVGETFANGASAFDFSRAAIESSVHASLQRLKCEAVDFVFIHSNGDDMQILDHTDAVPTLLDLRAAGLVKGIGLSGKTVAGAQAALRWADAIMVEYHLDDQTHESVIAEAAANGVGVVIKKGLSAGKLPTADAIRFVLANKNVSSLIVGSLSAEHMSENLAMVREL